MDGVRLEAEAPTSEQFAVLNRVAERVLQECTLEKEGPPLAKDDPQRAAADKRLSVLLPRFARGWLEPCYPLDEAPVH